MKGIIKYENWIVWAFIWQECLDECSSKLIWLLNASNSVILMLFKRGVDKHKQRNGSWRRRKKWRWRWNVNTMPWPLCVFDHYFQICIYHNARKSSLFFLLNVETIGEFRAAVLLILFFFRLSFVYRDYFDFMLSGVSIYHYIHLHTICCMYILKCFLNLIYIIQCFT